MALFNKTSSGFIVGFILIIVISVVGILVAGIYETEVKGNVSEQNVDMAK